MGFMKIHYLSKMIPTRKQIQDKVTEFGLVQNKDVVRDIKLWLAEINCPQQDTHKILDDLKSYPNFL